MQIVHVVPLSKGVFKEELTYFSAKHIDPGTIVTVSIRNRKAPALVVSSENASTQKSAIRSAAYAMKKIEESSDKKLFDPSFIEAARITARYFTVTTGEVLRTFTPKVILESAGRTSSDAIPGTKRGATLPNEKFILQADDEERLTVYKSLIREEFARGSSVFFCLPTVQDIERIADRLERGIKEYTYILHSGLSKKAVASAWKQIVEEPHPVLIVATGNFLSVPRGDISTLIVDKEHSSAYRTLARPFVDMRMFAEHLAEAQKTKLILGDMFLRIETLWRYEKGELLAFAPPKFRFLSTARNGMVDMRTYNKGVSASGFRIVSDELSRLVSRTKTQSEQLAILVSRRGLSPITVCGDCGEPVTCPVCTTPFVLHKKPDEPGKNYFLCHKCGRAEIAEITCVHCGSWRLTPLGIGTQKAYDELKAAFPDLTFFLFDGDTVKTPKQARTMMNEFLSTPGSVLVGTEMFLNYLDRPIAHTAVLSIDALFTLPNFRINERIFHLLLVLHAKAQKEFLIQTRNPDQPVWNFILQGNLIDFYREDIRMRKEFGYPPFVTAIKITCQGKKEAVERELDKLEKLFDAYAPLRYPSFIEHERGVYRENLLIRLPEGEWVDDKLLGLLRSLPPALLVSIDPENLL